MAENDLLAQLRTLTTCGRCGLTVRPMIRTTCWWCLRPMCLQCWKDPGHCGEPEALEILRRLDDRSVLTVEAPTPEYFTAKQLAARLSKPVGWVQHNAKLYDLGQLRERKAIGWPRRIRVFGPDDARKLGELALLVSRGRYARRHVGFVKVPAKA